ncbi:MAG TPA: MFS transporter, partial [Patescibacteria group bacterium]|nr:MFS transporter [Patescibacteria group bacterium]
MAGVAAPPAGSPPRTGWRAILGGPQGALTIGLTLITLSVATESLVITAIMPAIVRDIGGVSLYGLAFSAFFLAGLASIPIAGWGVDRFGPSVPFAATISIFLVATSIAALSPSMPLLVLARAGQGLGAAAQFTITQSTIARAYPVEARVRVLSLMSATWVLPGLIGPSLGAGIATLFGWRWAFGAILVPALLAAGITYPRLRGVGGSAATPSRPSLRRPVQVAVGTGLFITGLTSLTWWSALLVIAGLAMAIEALAHILPPGALRAARGL